ncbi:hypothetical protein FACS189465_2580 [Clostridia bacterium]|nr:hypothetical protein FACS189465_2580 [Clostridia bacterium]
MYINIGNFNKKIEIISYILTKDDDGFEIKTENMVWSTWAQVTNTSGTEIIRSNSDFASVKTRFLMRTPKVAVDEDMVIKFENQIYEIIYINDYGYNRHYTEIITNLTKQ